MLGTVFNTLFLSVRDSYVPAYVPVAHVLFFRTASRPPFVFQTDFPPSLVCCIDVTSPGQGRERPRWRSGLLALPMLVVMMSVSRVLRVLPPLPMTNCERIVAARG